MKRLSACGVAVLVFLAASVAGAAARDAARETAVERISLGRTLALYPSLVTVVGAEVDGRVNWLLVAHVGVLGHDRIVVSMNDQHYTNRGIIAGRKLSVNLVDRPLLPGADYVGSVSGAEVDKSGAFAFHRGKNGTPVIDAAPVSMELDVVDIYKTPGFDNFVCTVAETTARPDVLDSRGRLDYTRLKPVLFEFPTYAYLATGEIIGKCRRLDRAPGMCAKLPMRPDGITRLSSIEVYPEYLEEYRKYASEVGETSLREEPGVLAMYAVAEKDDPCRMTILEIYASQDAYKAHIASPHFRKYKQGTLKMVKSLRLSDQEPLNPANRLNNFMVD
ncbi:antibiotic biosynthesis monooxygenase [uncultured Desulfovibrio sp.]|uniref:antibiotic biosynthesis monooxygenase n=1 Tax=uncultured Desulfovibrio sp. TaxID=167968 RepID=UPI0025D8AA10|nr:antibiotic biosynthesis monooxygenase [uncultured Desulfovibrio sp.]